MGDVDRDSTRDLNDLNARPTRISFSVALFHRATHIRALWSPSGRPERPKKNSHAIRRENVSPDPILTSSGEQPATKTAQLVRVSANIVFFVAYGTPCAVPRVYLRSSHLPNRTAALLVSATPGEPSISTSAAHANLRCLRKKLAGKQWSLGPSCTFQAIARQWFLVSYLPTNRMTLTDCHP